MTPEEQINLLRETLRGLLDKTGTVIEVHAEECFDRDADVPRDSHWCWSECPVSKAFTALYATDPGLTLERVREICAGTVEAVL